MKLAMGTIVLGAALGCVGCGTSTEEASASAASALASDLVGTYDFVLARSDVAASVRTECEAQSNGDATRAASCFEDVEKEATTEKIRFSRDAEGRLVWTSFSLDSGREEISVELPISLVATAPGVVEARAAGWPAGTLVGRLTHPRAAFTLEHESDGALVLVDPKKGRLVYRRAG